MEGKEGEKGERRRGEVGLGKVPGEGAIVGGGERVPPPGSYHRDHRRESERFSFPFSESRRQDLDRTGERLPTIWFLITVVFVRGSMAWTFLHQTQLRIGIGPKFVPTDSLTFRLCLCLGRTVDVMRRANTKHILLPSLPRWEMADLKFGMQKKRLLLCSAYYINKTTAVFSLLDKTTAVFSLLGIAAAVFMLLWSAC